MLKQAKALGTNTVLQTLWLDSNNITVFVFPPAIKNPMSLSLSLSFPPPFLPLSLSPSHSPSPSPSVPLSLCLSLCLSLARALSLSGARRKRADAGSEQEFIYPNAASGHTESRLPHLPSSRESDLWRVVVYRRLLR